MHSRTLAVLAGALLSFPLTAQNICEGNGVGSAYIRITNAILGDGYEIHLGSPAAPNAFGVLSVSGGFGPTVFPSPLIGNICLDVFDPGYFAITVFLDGAGDKVLSAPVANAPSLLNFVPLYLAGLALEGPLGQPTISTSKTVRFSWESADSTKPTGLMALGRDLHTATSLQRSINDNRVTVFVAGGGGGNFMQPNPTDTTAIYDPLDQSFTAGPTLSTERAGHTATQLSDGRILIAGGTGLGGVNTATVDIYDPATNTITAAAPMSAARSGHRATLLDDGRVLITGGFGDWSAPLTNFIARLNTATDSAEVFDPVAGTWATLPVMASPRAGHVQVKLGDGRVLVATGINGGVLTGSPPFGSGQVPTYTLTTDLFDPATNTFVAGAPVPGLGAGYSAAGLLDNGNVLMTGGLIPNQLNFNAAIPTFATSVYDVALGTWNFGPNLVEAVAFHTQTSLDNGAVLLGGGMIGDLTFLAGTAGTQLLESAGAAAWTAGTPIGEHPVLGGTAIPRGTHSATRLHDGTVLFLGGAHLVVPQDDGWIYYY